jgi:RHS repeat-associated protein
VINGTDHKYGFNGQEFNEDLNLNVNEMTFRQYDNALGRFMAIDPLAEFYHDLTPYRFGFNNPVYWTDPLGLIEKSVVNDIFNRSGSGKTVWKNDGFAGFYTDDGGYVGYTSDDTDYNSSPGAVTNLPEVTVKVGDDNSSKWAAITTTGAIYRTKWYDNANFSEKKLNLREKWSNSDNLAAGFSYGLANDAFQVIQTFDFDLIPGRENPLTGSRANLNIDGTTNYNPTDGFVNTLSFALPFARGAKPLQSAVPKGLGYVQKFNAAQFSKLFKGNLSKLSPGKRSWANYFLNKGVNTLNNQLSNGLIVMKTIMFKSEK